MTDTHLVEAAKIVAKLAPTYNMTNRERHALTMILDTLPEEVTNPKPELPTAAGLYLTASKTSVARLDKDGKWLWFETNTSIAYPENLMPLTRLVPEKPPIVAKELYSAWLNDPSNRHWSKFVAEYVNKEEE